MKKLKWSISATNLNSFPFQFWALELFFYILKRNVPSYLTLTYSFVRKQTLRADQVNQDNLVRAPSPFVLWSPFLVLRQTQWILVRYSSSSCTLSVHVSLWVLRTAHSACKHERGQCTYKYTFVFCPCLLPQGNSSLKTIPNSWSFNPGLLLFLPDLIKVRLVWC